MSEIAVQLGQRIRALRRERGVSQEELSFKAGISAAHLGQIERAVKKPTVETIGKLAAALEVPVTALFSSAYSCETSTAPNATLAKINAQLASMSEEEQKDILRIIRIFRGYREKDLNDNE